MTDPLLCCLTVLRGDHPAIVALRSQIVRAAPSKLPVLVVGETGVGKELVASLLHQLGTSRGRLVAISMATMTADLAEAELCGTELGAFTGARRRDGLIRTANDGTLFLDEGCSTPLSLQSKLLRIIETKCVRRLGSSKEEAVNFRLITSSQHSVAVLRDLGLWREDFLQRVAGIVLHVPPLRERAADIPMLATSFLPPGVVLDPAALHRLCEHRWPGNVRELRRVVERACYLTDGNVIRVVAAEEAIDTCLPPTLETEGSLRSLISQKVRQEMHRHGNHVGQAARALGLSRATLYRWLRAAAANASSEHPT